MVHYKGQVEAMKKYCEAGFMGLIFSNEHGGLQLPIHISAITRIPFLTANVGMQTHEYGW